MANQIDPENQNDNPQPAEASPAENGRGDGGLLGRLPPRFRTKRYLIFGAIVAVLTVFFVRDILVKTASGGDEPTPAPAPVTQAVPTPEPTPIPREEYQLPKQYAFVHFVNETAACYDQFGQPATLEAVEADIMVDVPLAVSALLSHYAANRCGEIEPWHQIPGRMGWMLRASGVDKHLPKFEAPK